MRFRHFPLVWRQVVRRRVRTALTVSGVAVAMFLFVTIQAMQNGVAAATEAGAQDTTLVVYRENRFCPFTSRLPEDYERRIAAIPGVASVTPMKVVVNNCRTSLDVITYRGVRPARFAAERRDDFTFVAGDWNAWLSRTDAALVGRVLAERRGFSVGDRFDSSGITVTVAGIFESDEPQDQNVAYVDLEFLQRAPGNHTDGIVTQFQVEVDDPQRSDDIAAAIDAEFATAQEPTKTSGEKAFVARAAADAVELVGFTRWVGFGSVAAVLALVANAIVLSVQDRVKVYAVFQTLGFTGGLIGRLVIAEGVLLGVLGGVLGTVAAYTFLETGDFSLSNEGLSISLAATPALLLQGFAISAGLGVVAGLVPALRAMRLPIAAAFRAG